MFETLNSPMLMPALIMLLMTIIFASAFYWPAVRFPRKGKVTNFYWSGFWAYLGIITAVAGAQVTVAIIGLQADAFSNAVLTALTVTFVMFVVFAWARLALMGLRYAAIKVAA